jgi:tRNA dimethylallyltransferase
MDRFKKHPPGLIVICGATATGKSAIAFALAQALQTVLLSADSRQIYREFNIGTAKPSLAEQALVPHELIDLCDPTTSFTVADYQDQAQALIAKHHRQGLTPLLVGGTGLYIQAITAGLIIPRVAPHPQLRDQLSSYDQVQLYHWLQQVDPDSAERIHANDQLRTLRALEVYYVTGRSLSSQQGRNPPDFPILKLGLDCENLTPRIQRRTELMLAQGWLQEVEQLCQRYGMELPLLNTLGYQELKQHLQGKLSLDEAKDAIILHTRQFAKRQRTWFRAESQIHWFNAESPTLLVEIMAVITAWRSNDEPRSELRYN